MKVQRHEFGSYSSRFSNVCFTICVRIRAKGAPLSSAPKLDTRRNGPSITLRKGYSSSRRSNTEPRFACEVLSWDFVSAVCDVTRRCHSPGRAGASLFESLIDQISPVTQSLAVHSNPNVLFATKSVPIIHTSVAEAPLSRPLLAVTRQFGPQRQRPRHNTLPAVSQAILLCYIIHYCCRVPYCLCPIIYDPSLAWPSRLS